MRRLASMSPDPDDLISAAEVAEILGLSHRNSVSTYRRRYPDFPVPVPSPHGGRTLLWRRDEVLVWHRAWSDPDRRRTDGSARLEVLVEAAANLLLENPGTEIGVRQIAAAAGMAHSDVYRYADSKEQILALAAERLVATFQMEMPDSFGEFINKRRHLVEAVLQRQGGMRVIMAEVVRDPHSGLAAPTPAREVAKLVRADREEHGRAGATSPEVAAASVAVMLWGWALLGPRMCQIMGLPGIPADEISEMVRVMLES